LATFIAIFMVERVGSRTLMVSGTAVMSLALIGTGICLDHNILPDTTSRGIGVGIGLFFFSWVDSKLVLDVSFGFWQMRFLMKM